MLPNMKDLGKKAIRKFRKNGSELTSVPALSHASIDGNEEGTAALVKTLESLIDPFQSSTKLRSAVQDFVDSVEADNNYQSLFQVLSNFEMEKQRKLIRLFGLAQGGIYTVVRMREKLMQTMRGEKQEDLVAALKKLDDVFMRVLDLWFDPVFLKIESKSANNITPQQVTKLMEYQKVHEFQDYEAFKSRILADDRRCYAFSHPAYPDEPIIYIEVALTKNYPENIMDLLATDRVIEDPEKADTATFCSISNCHEGLAGIRFGEILIKEAVSAIQEEFPTVKQFCTLSPVPGFRKWLDQQIDEQGTAILTPSEQKLLQGAQNYSVADLKAALDFWEGATSTIEQGKDFRMNRELADLVKALEAPIMRLGHIYLYEAKRKDGFPLDPVARFHLSNGAQMYRLNYQGNQSTAGIRQSAGLMVNFVYNLADVEQNIQTFSRDKKIITGKPFQSVAKKRGLKLNQK